jgi:hypothetical protein
MDGKDWAIIFATLIGPILAVQAQKAVERLREYQGRKNWVFTTLMATRPLRVSAEHARALSIIDVAFFGRYLLGFYHWRTRSEQNVLDVWRQYLDHLGTPAVDGAEPVWNARSDDLFTNLLFAISQNLGFKLDRVQLLKGAYWPTAQRQIEANEIAIRKAALRVLEGSSTLKMDIASFPFDPAAVAAQRKLHEKLAAAVGDDGALTVDIRNDGERQ